jgi:hypothetical protein
MSKITLECVKEGRTKLRVRFHSYTDEEGRVFTNVYDNSFNCQFPRSIREEGRFYEIGPDDLSLVTGGSRQPFYKVRTAGIRIVGAAEVVVKPPRRREASASEATSSSRSSAAAGGAPVDLSEITIFEVTECVVCLSTAPNEVFLPCAHKCVCATCSKEIKRHSGNCPLCRRRIVSTIAA